MKYVSNKGYVVKQASITGCCDYFFSLIIKEILTGFNVGDDMDDLPDTIKRMRTQSFKNKIKKSFSPLKKEQYPPPRLGKNQENVHNFLDIPWTHRKNFFIELKNCITKYFSLKHQPNQLYLYAIPESVNPFISGSHQT